MPAGPDPLDRRPALRLRRRALRERRRRGQPRLRGLRADGHAHATPAATRPSGVGGTQTPPTSRGRRAAQPGPAHPRRPHHPRRHPPAREPGHRRGAARQPARRRAPIPNARRIVAYGLRNPFRFAIRPGTSEVWIGDVGWNTTEEINRVPDSADATVENFGWPCYEGASRQGGYDAANLNLCENLYARRCGAVTAPYLAYPHSGKVDPEDPCPSGHARRSPGWPSTRRAARCPRSSTGRSSSPTTRAAASGSWSAAAERCPAPARVRWFRQRRRDAGGHPVRPRRRPLLRRRLGRRRSGGSTTPRATRRRRPWRWPPPPAATRRCRCSSTPADRATPTATRSPTPGTPTATAPTTTPTPPLQRWTYDDAAASTRSGLRVTDSQRRVEHRHGGHHGRATRRPIATISSPSRGLRWKVGRPITLQRQRHGHAGRHRARPAGSSWSLVLHHCPSNCHAHALQSFPGSDGGSFAAPDHEYPSYLELRLTATDSGGLDGHPDRPARPEDGGAVAALEPRPGSQLAVNGADARHAVRRAP